MNIYWPDSNVVNRALLKEHIARMLWRIREKDDIPIEVMVACTLEAVASIVSNSAHTSEDDPTGPSDLIITIPHGEKYTIQFIHALEREVDAALLQVGFSRIETEKGKQVILKYRQFVYTDPKR